MGILGKKKNKDKDKDKDQAESNQTAADDSATDSAENPETTDNTPITEPAPGTEQPEPESSEAESNYDDQADTPEVEHPEPSHATATDEMVEQVSGAKNEKELITNALLRVAGGGTLLAIEAKGLLSLVEPGKGDKRIYQGRMTMLAYWKSMVAGVEKLGDKSLVKLAQAKSIARFYKENI